MLDKSVTFADIKSKILSLRLKVLREIKLIDVYEGSQTGNQKSYAIRLRFQDEEKTLRDDFVDHFMSRVTDLLEQELKATVRK